MPPTNRVPVLLSWLKDHHKVTLKVLSGKSRTVNKIVVGILGSYVPRDMHNVGESSTFYQMLLKELLALNKTFYDKEGLMLLLCIDTDGIGK